jgi:TPR repeat protein
MLRSPGQNDRYVMKSNVAILAGFALYAAGIAAGQGAGASLSAEQLAKWKATKPQLQAAADGGDASAAYTLGLSYEFPFDGRAANRSGAAYWYKQASDHGNVRATYRLGIFYYDQGSDDAAYRYFEQAAQQGMPAAMFRYGDMLVRTNFRGNGQYYGLPWLEKAANAGDPDAANELGIRAWQLYLQPGPMGSKYSAEQWFSRAATAGSCEGAMNLGGVYFNGVGVVQDAAKADLAFRAAISCPGSPAWVVAKAKQYREMIAAHRLPDPSLSKPRPYVAPARVDSHEDQMTKIVVGIVAVVGVAALLGASNHPSSPDASSSSDAMNDFYADMAKRQQDYWTGRSYCDAGLNYNAATLGVWCP